MTNMNQPYMKAKDENGTTINPITKSKPYRTFAPNLKRYNRRNQEVVKFKNKEIVSKKYKALVTSSCPPAYGKVPAIYSVYSPVKYRY
jgi:hypothetical protein